MISQTRILGKEDSRSKFCYIRTIATQEGVGIRLATQLTNRDHRIGGNAFLKTVIVRLKAHKRSPYKTLSDLEEEGSLGIAFFVMV